MRITGTGHAGLRIDTVAGSILCDPWVNPAFLASWFPFPDNSGLDWQTLGDVDYLYVSHLHRDHFDAALLKRFVSKTATVLLPQFPVTQMEDELRELGFTRFLHTVSGQVHELDGGLKIMIQALVSPTDGPLGDSSLWVEHNGIRLLNQNDARPIDLDAFARLGHVHAHLLQFSGAIWYPMAYELPKTAKTAFGKQKRERQYDRTWRYIHSLNADWVFPIAGPPCFLDSELWHLNNLPGRAIDGSDIDEGNIFPDQSDFVREYGKVGGRNAVVLLPGSVSEVDDGGCRTHHPVEDLDGFFAGKPEYLQAYATRQQGVIELEKARWAHPWIDVLAVMRERLEPLLAESVFLADGVGGPVRLDLTGDTADLDTGGAIVQSIIIDFAERKVLADDGRKVRYRFTTRRDIVQHLLHTGENDWVNSLFLSCRFTAARVGQYNEFIYTFFKCLSRERLQYAEGWHAEQRPDTEDISLGEWTVQRRCPHLKADLTRFAVLDGTTLTCQQHGWRFDLRTGHCLTSAGHKIRASR